MTQQPVFNFYKYPPIGDEDWEYASATARVRALQIKMLTKALFNDLVNAPDYNSALDMLSSTEYSLHANMTLDELEKILYEKRENLRMFFVRHMVDENVAQPLRIREDFANMRLALRRKLTEKPLGVDYSNHGSVPAEDLEKIFEDEDYSHLPYHMREGIEEAVLAYYQNKDIRQVDYALDRFHYAYKLRRAIELKNVFMLELFRMQIDFQNIKTLLRLKFRESDTTEHFLEGSYIGKERLKYALDADYDTIKQMFFSTPYNHIIEEGVSYLVSNKSFLVLEQKCDEHLAGYLALTSQIAAGPQPVIAFLLSKEAEIRKIRLILTAKKNGLDKELILDRIGK